MVLPVALSGAAKMAWLRPWAHTSLLGQRLLAHALSSPTPPSEVTVAVTCGAIGSPQPHVRTRPSWSSTESEPAQQSDPTVRLGKVG